MNKTALLCIFLTALFGLNPVFASQKQVVSGGLSNYQAFIEGCMANEEASAEACLRSADEWSDSKEKSNKEVIIKADYESWLSECAKKTSITDCLMI